MIQSKECAEKIEDGFCVSTLEKEGENSIRSAAGEDSLDRLEQIH